MLHVDGKPVRKKEPLLVIELENETAEPKVFYKGEEITLKRNVFFEWDTDSTIPGGLSYGIEHYEQGKVPLLNRIERKVKGHAMD